MKKYLLVLFTITASIAFGQLKKGNMLLAGSLSINPSKTESPGGGSINKNMYAEAIPAFGYFVTDRSVLGLEVGYTYVKNTSELLDFSSLNRQSSISFAPFYRHYFSFSDKVAFFLHGKFQTSFGTEKYSQSNFDGTSTGSENDLFSIGASIKPGFSFFLSDKWGVEGAFASFGYTHSVQKPDSGLANGKRDSFGLNYSNFALGVTYYINR